MKIISYLKDLLECVRLRRENARLKKMIRDVQGEEKLKEVEAEIDKKTRGLKFSKEKKQR